MAEPGQVNLRALPVLVVVEVLFGVQQRVRGGAKITEAQLRVPATDCAADMPPRSPPIGPRSPATSPCARCAPPWPDTSGGPWQTPAASTSRTSGIWRSSVTAGRCRSPQSASRGWSGPSNGGRPNSCPVTEAAAPPGSAARSTGSGCCRSSSAARLDRGLIASALGRSDIEDFLNRLAHLESVGEISRYRRNCICRDVREVLAGIRALGLTRPGQTAAGLAGDFAVERGDIPAEPERGEPGRDLPPEIMAVLCANLDTLEPVEVRVATQIGIDTGRRPEDILALPCTCLDRDKDGAAVLVYDNAKANRLGRRLPISEATAKVITGQQHGSGEVSSHPARGIGPAAHTTT